MALLLGAALGQNATQAGIILTFGSAFFQGNQQNINNYLHSALNGLTLPDQTPELHYGEGDLVTVSFPLTEQTVSGFSMSPQSSLALSEASPQLVFNLVGASLEFDFAYQLATDPVWLHDSGTGRVLISGMNASFLLTPAVVDGALELAFAPTGPVAMDDYQFALTGHTDVTKTFARLMTQFQDFFRAEVTALLADAMAEAFDDAFLELLNPTVQDEDGNVVVSDITRPVYQVPGTEVWLNYSMMPGNPIVQNDSVAFAFEGTFLDGELPWAQPLLPLASDGSAVSLAISEYTANSAAKAFFRENGLFLIQYPGLSPDTVNSLFPNFTADFGAAKVPIDISPAEAPVLSITQANTSASLRLLFALENPLNPAEDAIRVFATAALVLAPGMSPKTQHIVADILSLDVSVDSVECLYEETEVALADVEAMLAPAFDFFRKNLDADYLSVGVPLPAPVLGGNGPLPLGQLLAGATLTAMDGYYLVEAGARLRSEVI